MTLPDPTQNSTVAPVFGDLITPVASKPSSKRKLKPYEALKKLQATTVAKSSEKKAVKLGVSIPKKKTAASLPKKKSAAPKSKSPVAKKSTSARSGTCSICHKPLSRHTSVAAGMGDTCAHKIKLLPKGMTMEEHYSNLKVIDVPEKCIKLDVAITKAKAKGISGYRFVQAIGGDRMLRKPFNLSFKVVLVGNTRYISSDCLKHLEELKKK